jgi:hypothetical protein
LPTCEHSLIFAPEEDFISSGDAADLLGFVISAEDLNLWAYQGSVPGRISGGNWELPSSYIRSLSVFLGSEIARIGRPVDLYAKLCKYEYVSRWGTDGDSREVLACIRQLQRRRLIGTTSDVARQLNRHPKGVQHWPENRFLSSVTIRQVRYFPSRQMTTAQTVMAWPTLYEAATVLGLEEKDLARRMALRGELIAISTPGGLRFDPQALEWFAKESILWMPAKIAQEELGVTHKVLQRYAELGLVPRKRSVSSATSLYSAQGVRALKEQQNSVRPVEFIGIAGLSRAGAYSATQCARRLGVDANTVYLWAADGILPYYAVSTKQMFVVREFPRRYIDPLGVYLRLQPPSRKQSQFAIRYRDLCIQAGRLITPSRQDQLHRPHNTPPATCRRGVHLFGVVLS